MERDSFIFYRSFYEALLCLEEDDRSRALEAIMHYALDGEEIEVKGPAAAVFKLVKPQLEANAKRYDNGAKGGRPTRSEKPNDNQAVTKTKPKHNQTVTKAKPNNNQVETKPKPNDNVNVNDNDNFNENDNVNENGTGGGACKAVSVSSREKIPDEVSEIFKTYAKGDNEIVLLLSCWFDIRRSKGAAVVPESIRQNISKLDEIAKNSGFAVCDYLREIVRRGWGTFYPIDPDRTSRKMSQKKTGGESSFDLDEFDRFTLGIV